jgi:predicted lipoprotein with Yx(FWY)xxD motif
VKKKTFPAVAVLAAAAALVVAGCGSSGNSSSNSSGGAYGGSSATTTAPASTGSAGAATVSVGSASGVGQVLVDSNGMTLYYFKKDVQGNGKSTCYGSCASVWPPQTTSGAPKASGGAEASKLGAIKRTDGTMQVTYAGWPLYTYAADTKPGDAKGTDIKSFGASWYPLHPNGEKAGD